MERPVTSTPVVDSLASRAVAGSLWFSVVGAGCCADELISAMSSRYDLERFGMLHQPDPRLADLLIVCGAVNQKLAPEIKRLYETLSAPKAVIAVGACATCGGIFAGPGAYAVTGGVDQVIPVDVFVAGNPPRPEAIMDGILRLQEKLTGEQTGRRRR